MLDFFIEFSPYCSSTAETVLPVKPDTRNLKQEWATPSSTEYQDGGLEPEVVIT